MVRRGPLALALLLSACAAQPRIPMRPAAEMPPPPPAAALASAGPAAAPQAEAPPAAPAPEVLPSPVTENRAFVTVHGVPLYRIGPADVLEIVVTRGLTQDRQTVTVRSDGTVSVGLATIKADGATVEETADRLREGLALYYRDPRVEVGVKDYQSKRVTLLGALGAAPGRSAGGVFPLTGRNTLSEMLARAGGPAPNADLQRVQLSRADGSRFTVNLFRLISEGELRQDVVLDAGDAVFLPAQAPPPGAAVDAPAGAPEPPRVFVFGEVRTPGAYTFTSHMRVAQAMAMAGGISETGLPESVRVIRGNLDQPEIIEVNFEKLLNDGDRRQDLALQANDIVMVPRTGMANWNAFLAKLRPTLEFLTLTTATIGAGQGILLQQRAIGRGPAFR